MKSNDEFILISKVIAYNDHRAFEKLISLHQNGLKNFLLKLLNFNENEVDDLYQETCSKIFRNLKRFRGDSTFKTWSFKIAYNTFLNHKKKDRNIQTLKHNLSKTEETTNQNVQDMKIDLEAMIKILRPEEKAAIQLAYIQGLSHKDISVVLECPLGTVKSLIKRGKEKIASRFNNYQNEQ